MPTAKVPLPEPLLILRCQRSFKAFVREFFECVPGVGKLVWNWHLDLLCDELQEVADRVKAGLPKKHDLIVNICFGTSKSMITSVLFQAWVWASMPEARFLSGTHTDSLVLDLSVRCKDVIKCEKYQRFFPNVKLRYDRGAKEDWANTVGGERKCCTVGGVSPMGRHCLPYETLIMTDAGSLPIGKIVEERIPVRILGFDHASNQPHWQNIQTYQSNPIAPLNRIRLSDGKTLELTGEHPVFVEGRGYVEASNVRIGDRVLTIRELPKVRNKTQEAEDLRRTRKDYGLLLSRLLYTPSQRTCDGELCYMRKTIQGRNGGKRERAAGQVLLTRMCPQSNRGERSSALGSQSKKAVPSMRKVSNSLYSRREPTSVLQLQMSWSVQTRGKTSSICRENLTTMSTVREGNESQSGVSGICRNSSLFERLREQNTLRTYDWIREFQLHSRSFPRAIQQFVRQNKKENTRTGQVPLLSLRKDESRSREVGNSSYRLGQEKRFFRQPRNTLHELSSEAARENSKEGAYGEAIVVGVERDIRLPNAVYNLSVGPNNNYFANGVLTHNCHFIVIDDPIDPKGARSETEVETAARFMNEVIPSRMVDKEIVPIILVMQRLHPRDPTYVMLTTSKREGTTPVRHICLPGELCDGAGELSPSLEELKARYDGKPNPITNEPMKVYEDGLMDKFRLSRRVLSDYRARLMAFGYAGQVLQNPVPAGGGRFKQEWFSQHERAAPYEAVRVRAWDRAATCLIAGTLVETELGPKPIESVRIGDKVLTRHGYKRVLWSGQTGLVDELVTIAFNNGSVLTGTPDHLLWDTHNGWRSLLAIAATQFGSYTHMGYSFSYGEQLCLSTTLNWSELHSTVLNTQDAQEDVTSTPSVGTKNLVNGGGNLYTEPSGDTTTVKSRRGAISTTKTVIGTTTTFPIWSVYRAPNTTKDTVHLQDGTLPKLDRPTKERLWPLPQRCTNEPQKKALTVCTVAESSNLGITIPNELSSVPPNAHHTTVSLPKYASSVEQSFGEGQRPYAAQTIAQPGGWKPYVDSVKSRLEPSEKATNTAPYHVLPNIDGRNTERRGTPVYDLTVEDAHEFFANGILVHNSEGGAATAGVLMARTPDGRLFVEDVVWGQWEPHERNEIIVATAKRDRLKYGPKYDPTIVIEAERGSTGMESFQHLARRLMGYRIREAKTSANKDARAEPWADQLAAMNVWFVVNERMTWDFDAYVQEHVLFRPDLTSKRMGGFKDRVDSSSHALAWLSSHISMTGAARVLAFRKSPDIHKRQLLKLVACPPEMLDGLHIEDHPTILIRFVEPELSSTNSVPETDSHEPVDGVVSEIKVEGSGREDENGRTLASSTLTIDAGGVVFENDTSTASVKGEERGGRDCVNDVLRSPPSPFSPIAHLTKNMGYLELTVADIDPKDYQDKWTEKIPAYGKLPEEVMMSREHGKKLWAFVTKKWPVMWEVAVIVGAGGLPLSASRALAVGMGLKEAEAVYDVATGGFDALPLLTGPVPNQFVFDLIKSTRSTVV